MRIDYREVDLDRIMGAIRRRLSDIPEAIAWNFSDAGRSARERLERFRNIHSGERCFVIANGPSLKKTDMRRLKGEYTFSMNRAYLMYDEWGFVPTYYTCSNDLVMRQFSEDMRRLPMPKFVNFNCRDLFGDEANYLRLPPSMREWFSQDITKPIGSGATVTYFTLQIAYFMGFSRVVLVGLDHKFSEKGTPGKTEVRQYAKDESHMHPNYFPQGIKWQLPDLVRSEHAYAMAKDAFESTGRTIVDATVEGACPIFRRMDFDAAVESI